jgi:hypothetical protein
MMPVESGGLAPHRPGEKPMQKERVLEVVDELPENIDLDVLIERPISAAYRG